MDLTSLGARLKGDVSVFEQTPRIQELLADGTGISGALPGVIVRLISEGKASFEGCEGPFTLPEDLSSISDIQKVDLTSLDTRVSGADLL